MCGRCRCTLNPEDVPRACGINASSIPVIQSERYHSSYNVSPGTYLPVVRKKHGANSEPIVHCMKWGLIPSITKKTEKPDHFKMLSVYDRESPRHLKIINIYSRQLSSLYTIVPSNLFLVVEGLFQDFHLDAYDGNKIHLYCT